MSIEAVSGQTEHHESFRAATDIVLRRRVTLWEPFPPKSKILMDLYRYWETLRPTGLLPNRTDFEMDRLRPVMGNEIAARLDFLTHSYARLILPFAKDGRRVDQLYVCSTLTKFPDLLEALH